jgi:hypothetical protein
MNRMSMMTGGKSERASEGRHNESTHKTCFHGISIAQDDVQQQAGVLLVLTPTALLSLT